MAKLTLDQLKRVMRHYAALFSNPLDDTWQDVNPALPLSASLPDSGVGTATPRRLFKGAVRFVLHDRGHAIRTWPADWVEQSIDALAPQLI